jgi:hypothetical protein
MINKLTKKQEEQMVEVRDYWIDKVYSCDGTNEEVSVELVEYIYSLANLDKPTVIFADSPLSANIIAHRMRKDTVRNSVWNSVWNSVTDSVWNSVWNSVRNSVTDSVWNSVWDSVGDSVTDSVTDSVAWAWVNVYDNLWYGEVWTQGWHAFYDFFTRQTGLIQHKEFEKYINLVDRANAYYIIPLEKVCIVTKSPECIHKAWRGDRWVMHDSEGNMAIKWRDGWGQYVLDGVIVDEKMYREILEGDTEFKSVMAIENIEHRMLYLKYMDVDKMLEGAGATLIDTGRKETLHFDYNSKSGLSGKVTYNQLYLVCKIFSQDEYFLRYEDPSTGRVYMSCVDPEVGRTKDADMCMAWKFGISKEMYMELKTQA